MSNEITPFEAIRRTNPAGNEYWSSRDFARVLGYVNYRHFLAVIEKARTACFNSGQRVEDHFVGIDEMIGIGKGGQRPVQTVMMSRYACYPPLKASSNSSPRPGSRSRTRSRKGMRHRLPPPDGCRNIPVSTDVQKWASLHASREQS